MKRSRATTAGELGELRLIEQIRRGVKAPQHRARAGAAGLVTLGIGDDCAILQPPAGHELLVTTDFSLEGRHFRRDWHTPESIGHRTLARGLSDLAAMGARPMAAFLSLALPAATPVRFVASFMEGFGRLADSAKVTLAGGDTAQSPAGQILADVVLVGSAPAGTALRRSAARPGDRIYVTGALGGAAQELLQIQNAPGRRQALRRPGSHPQLFPEPRLAAGWALRRQRVATACMDLSDGLSSDLAKLCEASSVAAEIELAALPLHPLAAARGAEALRLALDGGEDYELLFTASPATKVPRSIGGVPITRIGQVVERAKRRPLVVQIGSDGSRRALRPGGWEHLR